MRKVNCEACGAAYEVDPRRIPPNGMKMRCPACGASVHVSPEAAAKSPPARGGLSDLDLDLPAPKSPKAGMAASTGAPSLPPLNLPAKPPASPLGRRELELSDLPAVKARGATRPAVPAALSASVADDLTDLPAPKQPRKEPPTLGRPSTSSADKPASPAARAPIAPAFSGPASDSLHPALKKTTPAVVRAMAAGEPRLPELELDAPDEQPKPKGAFDDFDVDLPVHKPARAAQPGAPAPSQASSMFDDVDLPAHKPKPAAASSSATTSEAKPSAPFGDIDLPVAKGKSAGAFGNLDVDLPAHKHKPSPHTPQGLDLDAPLERTAAPATPKKSFAKPSAGPPVAAVEKPPIITPDDSMFGDPSGGMMPKDSLAIEPKAFFGNAPPPGMFGKLDDLEGNRKPPRAADPVDLIDLPAPSDLPAIKRPPQKGTGFGLGLGGSMPKDSLDLPAHFGSAPAPLPEIVPAREPRSPFDSDSDDTAAPAAPVMSELDLPAPRDLPTVKKRPPPKATALGLGGAQPLGQPLKGGFEVQLLNTSPGAGQAQPQASSAKLSGGRGGAELALELPPMSNARHGARPEIDLGEFERALDNLESPSSGSFGALHGDIELPARSKPKQAGTFGDLEPIALPMASASNNNSLPLSTMELSSHDLLMGGRTGPDLGGHLGEQAARRGDLGLELNKGSDGLSAPPLADLGGDVSSNFGELDLGVGRESQVGLPIAIPARRSHETGAHKSLQIEDAEFVDEHGEAAAKKKRRGERPALPAWAIPLALVGVIGSSGVALGLFTEHGWFGVYLMEQLLPAAGNAEQVRTAIEQAQRQAKTDLYVDVRRSLVTLSDARNEAGLNRELLARSLLHEALYQLRFGEDAQSAQRSAAILTRVLERGTNVVGLSLARAADAARRGDLGEAKRLLGESDAADRYHGLVAGELALLEKQPEVAAKGFLDAITKGETARGQWGLARAHLAANQLPEAEAAARATLAASPRHSRAHILLAQQALRSGAIDDALTHTRSAAGYTPIDGTPARPSKAERSLAFSLEGRIEEKRDHLREAQAAYERALAGDPLHVPDLLGSGRMLMRLARPQEALSRFDSALSAKPSPAPDAEGRIPLLDAGLGSIQAMLALQRPQEALVRSTALMAQFPADAEIKLWHGYVLEALERHDEAESSFRDTMAKAPKLFGGYVALSQLLFKRGRPEEAARVLSLASGQVEDSAEVRRMLGHSELTRQHLPEAIRQFEAALLFDKEDGGALYGLAVAQRKSGAIDAASATIDRLEKADPTFPGLALERGQILENRGAYLDAIEAYRKALLQRPTDSDLKLRLGATLVTAGKVDEAELVLGEVLKERPTSAEAEHYLGRVLFARKETAQAAQRFERAVNFDTLKAEYHLYLAWALLEQGNFGGALQSVQKSIERDPNAGDARWILGRIQLRMGAVKDALLNFQSALRLKPGRVEALAAMGDAYDELRDLNQAIKSYQDALKQAPDNAEWWYRLGQLQLDKGHRDDARVALSEAVVRGDRMRDRPSWLADAHRAYGDVLRESKRAGEAAEHYRLFLELAPLGHPDRGEIEQLLFQTKR